MKVCAIQLNTIPYDKEANLKKAASFIEEALDKGAEIIALPELFNTGYCCYEKEYELSEELCGQTSSFLLKYAEKYGVCFIAGFIEKSNIPGLVYDSVMFVSKDAAVDSYRKIYLWQEENTRFLKGNSLKRWFHGSAVIAPQICYEAGFPENAKISALKGANLLVNCAAFNQKRLDVWDIETRSRAIETGSFVIAANHSETEHDKFNLNYCAHSRIIDPKGKILCEASLSDEAIIADIDLNLCVEQRRFLPYLRDIDPAFTAKEFLSIQK